MKTIGILGGMSFESTTVYYQEINQLINKNLKSSHSAKILLYSFDYRELEILLEQNDWEKITHRLITQANKLKLAGADFLLIGANTMHIVADQIEEATQLKICHIVDATLENVKSLKLKKVLLLGTKYTMQSSIYQNRFEKQEIEVITPPTEDQDTIHDIIYNELILGDFKVSSKQKIIDIMKSSMKHGVQGFILGCTEIPLLIHEEDVDAPIFNTLKLHAKQAVKWMIDPTYDK